MVSRLRIRWENSYAVTTILSRDIAIIRWRASGTTSDCHVHPDLVLIYRNQIKAVTERKEFNAPQSYEYVGQVDGLKDYPRMNVIEWRCGSMSTTRLASLFPLLAFASWLGALVILFVNK